MAQTLEQCTEVFRTFSNVESFFSWQIICDLLELDIIQLEENSWGAWARGQGRAEEGVHKHGNEGGGAPLYQAKPADVVPVLRVGCWRSSSG